MPQVKMPRTLPTIPWLWPCLAFLLGCSEAKSIGSTTPPSTPTGTTTTVTTGAQDAGLVLPPSTLTETASGTNTSTAITKKDCGTIKVVYRDFLGSPGPDGQQRHPDFQAGVESKMGEEKGLVQATLRDQKPVYAPVGPARTVNGPDTFGQWYTDVEGVNLRVEDTLTLVDDPTRPGVKVFDSAAFFPLDGKGWQATQGFGFGHNYHFTTEIHTEFAYQGGEVFTFTGDDDVFVFVNDQLAIDLGGIHTKQTGTVDFDAQAEALGLTKGQTYPLDVFHAERHTEQSNFHMETTIACLIPIVIP
jgi:fibro-slime domain-containing protein